MKKLFIIMMMTCQLAACRTTVKPAALDEEVTISVFRVEGCGQCEAFMKYGIPYLEKTFGDAITIDTYDLDDDASRDYYDDLIKRQVDYDEANYGLSPLIAFEGHFAYLGYLHGDEKWMASDLINSIKGKPLCEELSSRRTIEKKEGE